MKEYTISIQVDVSFSEDDSILKIERKVKDRLEKSGPILMERAFKRQEQSALERDWDCPRCKEKYFWQNRGRRMRKVVTLAGAVSYARVRWCCGKCGMNFHPLDAIIGLASRENVTLGLIEQSLWLAVEMPYDRAASGQERLCGVKVSGRQMQNWVKAEGQRLKFQQESDRKALFERGILSEEENFKSKLERVFVQVDGTFVNERSGPGEIEAKVGVIYSEKEKVAKNRWEILDKRTFASTEKLEEFREQFVLECQRWGVWEANEIIFAGDGAAWIKKMCKEYFPSAIYILDYWHLMEKTYWVFGEERRMAANELLLIAKAGRAQEFYEQLDRIYRRSRDPDFREKIETLLEYVKNNLDGIDNYRKVGMVGSSGAIEKTVDITICRRFKKRGMSWLYPGLSSLLSLKLLKLNGEWEHYWKSRGVPFN